MVIAIYVLLHSAKVHAKVLQVAQEKATAALGLQTRARDFRLTFSGISPAVDLYDVTIAGAPPYTAPPLATADHLLASVRITSLLHQTWYLEEIRLDHPVIRVFEAANGTDNLPKTQSTSSQGSTNVFDLGVRHAQINNGEIYYNNRKSLMNADLHDLTFEAAFNVGQQSYSGSLGYRDGHLQVGSYNPLPHDLDAHFTATRTSFNLDRALLRSGASQISLTARLDDYSQPRLQAKYDATLDTAEFRRILKNPSIPQGVVRMNGTVNYASEVDVPMMAALRVDGDLSSRAMHIAMPSIHGDITGIGARYALANGNAVVSEMHAHLLGGELTGNAAMRGLSSDAPHSTVHASLRGVSLADLKRMMNPPSLQNVGVTGGVNASADANWGKTLDDLRARVNGTIQAQVSPNAGAAGVPLSGAIHASYNAAGKQLTLSQSELRMPATRLDLDGTVSDRSALAVKLQSQNLHQLEAVADMFRPAPPGQAPLGLYGTASFTGTVQGATNAPRVTGHLEAQNLRVKGTAWRVLRSDVNLTPSEASLQHGLLQSTDGGQVTFNLSSGLDHWSFTNTSPLQVSVNARQMQLANLAKIGGLQTPVSGTLATNVALHGTELNPVGQGSLSLTNAKVSGETIQSLNANFSGTGDRVQTNLTLRMPAGTAQGTAIISPKSRTYQASLHADGIHLEQLQALKASNAQISGVLNLDADGRGSFDNPELSATVNAPQLHLANQTISQLRLQANVANHVANVSLDTEAMNTALRGHGTVQLTGAYLADIALDTQPIELAPIVAIYAPSQAGNISGQTELHATLRGPLKNRTAIDAHAVIPVLKVNYKNTVQIGATAPIRIDYTKGVLNLQRTTISGTDTNLELQGTVPVVNRAAPMSLMLVGNIDLKLAALFSPDVTSAGQLQFNINSYGQRSDPNMEGQVRIVNASFATGDAPIGLENGNGVLTLTSNRLEVTQFQGTVGGGTVKASGGVVYRPSLRFDLAVDGRNVRMLYPDGVREQFDLNLALNGTPDSSSLNGKVRLDQLSFTPDFDLTTLMGSFSNSTEPPPSQGLTDNLKMNLTVQSSNNINLVSRELSLDASANLRVQGTAAQPVVLGRINLNGGDLIFQGNRYVLQSGFIDFVNPYQTQPVLNVRVDTTIQQYNIHMNFRGPVDQLHTAYTSDPSLPPPDIINLIAFGKTTEASAANPSPPGALGAESLIASQVSGQVTSRISKIAGISQLSIDPVLGGAGVGQGNPGARITVQQRVTGSIFVTFSSDVTSTQQQTVQLQYRYSPRVSFTTTRDQNGGFGFETRIRKVW